MTESESLISAYRHVAGEGWREVAWTEVRAWRPGDGLLWVHLDRVDEDSERYLREESGLDPIVAEALLEEETRPRALRIGEGLLMILRGVNLNPGAEPEDMVSVRAWVDAERIVTTRHRRIMAVADMRSAIAAGAGPKGSGDFVVMLADHLTERMADVIASLDEEGDELEETMVAGEHKEIRARLAVLRRRAITLRRYLAPQREALGRLLVESLPWFTAGDAARLREIADRVIRYVEDLDSVRERAAVIQDELTNRLSEQLNRNMYLLSLVATVMLPLGFLTGLLGINVDGIPGSSHTPWAFGVVCALLALVVAVEILVLKRLRWI